MRTMMSVQSNLLHSWKSKQLLSKVAPWIPRMVKSVPYLMEIAPANEWKVHQVYRSLSDMNVLALGSEKDSLEVILYLPESNRAVRVFEKQREIWDSLYGNPRLGEWRCLLPRLLYEGQFQGQPYWVVDRLPGVNAEQLMFDPFRRKAVLQCAAEAISYLHQQTAEEVAVDETLLDQWIFQPVQVICRSNLGYYQRRSQSVLNHLVRQLADSLRGQQLVVSWIHGDFWPANILVTPDGSRVTGIVDWGQAQPDGLPSLDWVNLLVSTRRITQGRELGEILAELLEQAIWNQDEQLLCEAEKKMLDGKTPAMRESLLIFWLQHLAANLNKSRRYSINPIWAIRNYVHVLNRL